MRSQGRYWKSTLLCHWGGDRAHAAKQITQNPTSAFPFFSLHLFYFCSPYTSFLFSFPSSSLHSSKSIEGGMSVEWSLDVLNNSWQAVSQLCSVLWMITGACMQHHTTTHAPLATQRRALLMDWDKDPRADILCVKKCVQWHHAPPPPSQQSSHPLQPLVCLMYRHYCLLDESKTRMSFSLILANHLNILFSVHKFTKQTLENTHMRLQYLQMLPRQSIVFSSKAAGCDEAHSSVKSSQAKEGGEKERNIWST